MKEISQISENLRTRGTNFDEVYVIKLEDFY